MRDVFYWFWTAMIFSSIAWYFFLLFYVGVKGGWEVVQLTEALSKQGYCRNQDSDMNSNNSKQTL